MIDSSRSPRPLWKRALTMIFVAVAISALAWGIWVKELHHPPPHIPALSGLNAGVEAPAFARAWATETNPG